ncbi:EAL domain-containing protein [Pectinatus frisingensis]|uniref:EAL domain-containing protein n=2 Tax=Pectinatus frisingensis TaxID=865 RepID=UPI0018C729DF|nr:EAL domain-containing protein [Pectinatus frisingensis]
MNGFIKTDRVERIFNLNNIRTRLLLIMLLFMITSLSILTAVSYHFSNDALTQSINKTAQAIGTDYSHRTSAFINNLVVYVQDLANCPDIVHPAGRTEIIDTLSDALNRNPYLTTISYGDLAGNVIRATGKTDFLGNRDYYQKAVQTRQLAISEPIISNESGRFSISIAVPVFTNEMLTGIVQATMPLDSLMNMVNGISFMNNGYGFIVTQSGTIIAHGTHPEFNGKANLLNNYPSTTSTAKLPEYNSSLINLFHTAINNDSPTQGVYNTSEGNRFVVFTPVRLPDNSRWLVAVSAPQSIVTSNVSELNMILLITALICLLIGTLIIFLLGKHFARPEEKYFKAFRHVADAVGIVNLSNGKIIEVNNAFFNVLGYNREDIIGRRFEESGLWKSADKKKCRDILLQHMPLHNIYTTWYTKNNEQRIGILSAESMLLGKSLYAVFIWHDVTEQLQAETALHEAYGKMEQEVEKRTQELCAANQELTAMNEEICSINTKVQKANDNLHEEIHLRQQVENNLLLREKQYRATTNLFTRPSIGTDKLAELILFNAIQLVGAMDGFIGKYDRTGTTFSLEHGIGMYEQFANTDIKLQEGPLKSVYNQGLIIRGRDRWQYHDFYDSTSAPLVSMILVPLKQENTVHGVLAVIWQDDHDISDEDITILRQFADLAFLAIERVHAQQNVERVAFYDSLTNLPNRANLHMRLKGELAKAATNQSEGIIYSIDLDDFKAVNDTFGHSAGDKVITATGKALLDFFAGNAFVARISSDEFAVIVPGKTTKQKAADIATRLSARLCSEYDIDSDHILLSASIGVILYPSQGKTVEDILRKVDTAMYSAKQAGKNCWKFFVPELLHKNVVDTVMINNLHKALPRNELFLQYQPQFSTDGKRLIGLEALLRWKNPEHGLVSPARFIPLAERSWLILEIGQWVFEEVCKFARFLANNGKTDLRIAVNISPRQIKQDNFIESIFSIINKTGVSPQQIEVEITESVLMENFDDVIPKLKALQDNGLSLALDDFGTGFSSLTYLRNLPINCLKIDKSFIDKITMDTVQLEFVSSIINLGHILAMDIIAEGVETQEQLNNLRDCSCDYIQGYVFSKPIDRDAAVKLCLNSIQ